jgi:hypothetical protein
MKTDNEQEDEQMNKERVEVVKTASADILSFRQRSHE